MGLRTEAARKPPVGFNRGNSLFVRAFLGELWMETRLGSARSVSIRGRTLGALFAWRSRFVMPAKTCEVKTNRRRIYWVLLLWLAEPAEMSGPEVAKTPGGGAPGKEGKEPVANGHAGDSNDANPFAEYMWMENEEEYNRQVWWRLLLFTFNDLEFFAWPVFPARWLTSRWRRSCWSRSSWSAASRRCWRRRTRTGSSHRATSTTRGWASCSSSSMACRWATTTATWRKWRWVDRRQKREQNSSSFVVNFLPFPLQRKSILNPEAKEFVPGKKY